MNVVTRTIAATIATAALTLSVAPAHAVDFPQPEPMPDREGWTCLADEHLAYINTQYNRAQDAADAWEARTAKLTQSLATSGAMYRILEAENEQLSTQLVERDAKISRKDATIERLREKLRNR